MTTSISSISDGIFNVVFNDYEYIRTTVTSSGDDVEDWLDEILRIHRRRLRRLVVGLDVEWLPNYRRGYVNPVALLQICVGRRCLVFQILHADYIPWNLADFLSNKNFTFVGVGIDEDALKLERDYGLEVRNTEDLSGMAAERMERPELRRAGLKNLVREVMGVLMEKPKRVSRSKWNSQTLSMEQVKYACVDAFTSFEVGRRLKAGEF